MRCRLLDHSYLLAHGVIGAYSTIVMVYFKLKSYVVNKSDPYNSGKFRKESYIYKSGYRGIALLNRIPEFSVRTHVEWRGKEHLTVRPEGWPQQLLLQLLSLDVSRWKKYLVHFFKRALLSRYIVLRFL